MNVTKKRNMLSDPDRQAGAAAGARRHRQRASEGTGEACFGEEGGDETGECDHRQREAAKVEQQDAATAARFMTSSKTQTPKK